MIHLRTRTEHSYQTAVGKIEDVLDRLTADRVSITDRHGTWGHVRFYKEAKKRGKTPILGVELGFVADVETKERSQPVNYMTLLARNYDGLKEIYQLTSIATEKFYYVPLLDYPMLEDISSNVIILSGSTPQWELIPKKLKNFYVELNQLSGPDAPARAKGLGYKLVATGDNIYPSPEDRDLYEVCTGDKKRTRISPGHIIAEWEWKELWNEFPEALKLSEKLAKECNVTLPSAKLIKPAKKKSLRAMCVEGAKKKAVDLKDKVYAARLDRELKMIDEKQFEDYFYIVADMIGWAKKRMMVGPARGSSCGSLVCYLLDITDIDPIPFDLLFERFIDYNRLDLPDIDIDFQDNRRELVFEYIREKYGYDRVARLGTISVFKPKSALQVCAKELDIPQWEIKDLKDSIVERSSGDARAAFCILDTFQQLEVGKATLEKYPELAIAAKLEGHASHTGQHSAGILITADPITDYCARNEKTGNVMIDKKDAESLNLLKIDALGLRTLAVIQDTLDQVGWKYEDLRNYRQDDKKAFEVVNSGNFAGIFQYEGYALQSLTKQMNVSTIEDIIVITALARPGPLDSGGAEEFIKRRTGQNPVKYLHPLCEDITRVTYGIIVYQEQVMQIAREVGALSWENVSELRRAMSKSMGKEFFDRYWEIFWSGAKDHMTKEEAREIWDNVNTMGSWAFNRSHAVAYGTISYWCCVLKSKFPLEFAAATLRSAKDDEQSIRILRELSLEGFKYKPFDRHVSASNWTVANGELIGGLTSIKGIGEKLAATIIAKREGGKAFTAREEELLTNGETPWDRVFECADKWGHIIRDPARYGIATPISEIESITSESTGKFLIIAKLQKKALRDHNEDKKVAKRNGKRMEGETRYLNLTVEDDTGTILVNVGRFDFEKYGSPIIEEGRIGDWYLIKASAIGGGLRMLKCIRWKKLTGDPFFGGVLKKSSQKTKIVVPSGTESSFTSDTAKKRRPKKPKN